MAADGHVMLAATVIEIGEGPYIYPACKQCYSKLTNRTGYNQCSKCGQRCSYDETEFRYRLCLSVTDGTTIASVTAFGGMLSYFFGITAVTFYNCCESRLKEKYGSACGNIIRVAVEQSFVSQTLLFGFKIPVSAYQHIKSMHKAYNSPISLKDVCLGVTASSKSSETRGPAAVVHLIATQVVWQQEGPFPMTVTESLHLIETLIAQHDLTPNDCLNRASFQNFVYCFSENKDTALSFMQPESISNIVVSRKSLEYQNSGLEQSSICFSCDSSLDRTYPAEDCKSWNSACQRSWKDPFDSQLQLSEVDKSEIVSAHLLVNWSEDKRKRQSLKRQNAVACTARRSQRIERDKQKKHETRQERHSKGLYCQRPAENELLLQTQLKEHHCHCTCQPRRVSGSGKCIFSENLEHSESELCSKCENSYIQHTVPIHADRVQYLHGNSRAITWCKRNYLKKKALNKSKKNVFPASNSLGEIEKENRGLLHAGRKSTDNCQVNLRNKNISQQLSVQTKDTALSGCKPPFICSKTDERLKQDSSSIKKIVKYYEHLATEGQNPDSKNVWLSQETAASPLRENEVSQSTSSCAEVRLNVDVNQENILIQNDSSQKDGNIWSSFNGMLESMPDSEGLELFLADNGYELGMSQNITDCTKTNAATYERTGVCKMESPVNSIKATLSKICETRSAKILPQIVYAENPVSVCEVKSPVFDGAKIKKKTLSLKNYNRNSSSLYTEYAHNINANVTLRRSQRKPLVHKSSKVSCNNNDESHVKSINISCHNSSDLPDLLDTPESEDLWNFLDSMSTSKSQPSPQKLVVAFAKEHCNGDSLVQDSGHEKQPVITNQISTSDSMAVNFEQLTSKEERRYSDCISTQKCHCNPRTALVASKNEYPMLSEDACLTKVPIRNDQISEKERSLVEICLLHSVSEDKTETCQDTNSARLLHSPEEIYSEDLFSDTVLPVSVLNNKHRPDGQWSAHSVNSINPEPHLLENKGLVKVVYEDLSSNKNNFLKTKSVPTRDINIGQLEIKPLSLSRGCQVSAQKREADERLLCTNDLQKSKLDPSGIHDKSHSSLDSSRKPVRTEDGNAFNISEKCEHLDSSMAVLDLKVNFDEEKNVVQSPLNISEDLFEDCAGNSGTNVLSSGHHNSEDLVRHLENYQTNFPNETLCTGNSQCGKDCPALDCVRHQSLQNRRNRRVRFRKLKLEHLFFDFDIISHHPHVKATTPILKSCLKCRLVGKGLPGSQDLFSDTPECDPSPYTRHGLQKTETQNISLDLFSQSPILGPLEKSTPSRKPSRHYEDIHFMSAEIKRNKYSGRSGQGGDDDTSPQVPENEMSFDLFSTPQVTSFSVEANVQNSDCLTPDLFS